MLSIDLFANCRNAQLQNYLSAFPDMIDEGIDALSHTCNFSGVLHAFPPTSLLTAVLGRIRATVCPGLLLDPAWPKQPWYNSLVELSVAHAVHLLLEQFPLLQGNFTHPSSKMFKLHGWTLQGCYPICSLGEADFYTGTAGDA